MICLIDLKNPHLLGMVMFLRGSARKACEVEKICDAKQKPGLKPPLSVVDNPILANFLILKMQSVAAAILFLAILFLHSCNINDNRIHIAGNESNDLVKVLKGKENIQLKLYSDPLEAAGKARRKEALLVLADNYPVSKVILSDDFYKLVKEKELRAYIEFPDRLPEAETGKTEKADAERAVVNSRFFNGRPDSLGILSINGLHYLEIPPGTGKTHIVAAKVAGFDSAIYGLPEKSMPLLIEMEDYPLLISATNLSSFVTGRYAPKEEWAAIWMHILEFVMPGLQVENLDWQPVVRPFLAAEEVFPEKFQLQALQRGIEWYKNARMLIPTSWEDTLSSLVESGIQRIKYSPEIPPGDGSNGVFECIFSEIDENGSQPIGIMKRGDCISETSMAFAAAGKVFDNSEYLEISKNLLDYYLLNSYALKKEYGDPGHGAYGLIPWGISNHAWYRASYGDDNARFILAAITAAALTGSDHWDEILMRSLVALLRTTGKNGFRGSRINLEDFQKNGWRFYYNREIINPAPHFECYLWACFLWAYDKTGDPLFLERAKRGINIMMELYPDGWRWTNGLAQERARMILPLAWLVRTEDTPGNREMLMTVVNDFLKLQDQTGAIREELGDIKMGKYPPPQSNEAYGTNEASLIAQNGDPVSDLLYTTNFAFLGLHEAAFATDDEGIKGAADKLAEFLCRIQVSSKGHPELDGGWMRAFDFRRFEHWGSNADHGWGAWSIETGWTQGWITAILSLREMDTSIWELTENTEISRYHDKLKKMLIPD